jgi:SAM-dependent methyltransferase
MMVTVGDPYVSGLYRWWHLSAPSPELLAAEAARALGEPGVAVDLGCGLGSEIGYLAARGWRGVGVDLSPAALAGARSRYPGVRFACADVTRLPLRAGVVGLLLDRGCFHYLGAPARGRYAQEAARVLRAGGRLLLRMCLTSAGVRNDLDEVAIRSAFCTWQLASIERVDLHSDTRIMPAIVAVLVRPDSAAG